MTYFKAPHVERVIREVGRLLRRSYNVYRKQGFLERLRDVEHVINNRPHRGLLGGLLSPKEAEYSENEDDLLTQQYLEFDEENQKIEVRKPSPLKIDDVVRIAYPFARFRKGYKGKYSKALFRITKVHKHRLRYMYNISKYPEMIPIDGLWYAEELTPVRV